MKPSDKNDLVAYFSEPIGELQDKIAVLEEDVRLAGRLIGELYRAITLLTKEEADVDRPDEND